MRQNNGYMDEWISISMMRNMHPKCFTGKYGHLYIMRIWTKFNVGQEMRYANSVHKRNLCREIPVKHFHLLVHGHIPIESWCLLGITHELIHLYTFTINNVEWYLLHSGYTLNIFNIRVSHTNTYHDILLWLIDLISM